MGDVLVHGLDNGLTILGYPDKTSLSAAVGLFVASGARDEKPYLGGISHLIEHMLFKGTANKSALDITHAISDIGAQSNAFTSEEETVYYAALLPQRLLQMEDVFFEMLNPSFPEEELILERQVVLEELSSYGDRPQFLLFERAFRDYFGEHPCGNSILGTEESVSKISRKDLADFFKARYSPANIVAAAVGNFDWDSFLAHSREIAGSWNGPGRDREHKHHEHRAQYAEYFKEKLHQAHIAIFLPGPSVRDEEKYACSVLSTIMGYVTGSRLHFKLVEAGLAETATMETDERDDTGCLTLYATTEPGNAERVAAKIRHCLRTALDFSDDDLQRAKRKLCVRMVQSTEVPLGRLITLGSDYLALARVVSLREHLDRIQAITRKDIEKAVEIYPLTEPAEFRLMPG